MLIIARRRGSGERLRDEFGEAPPLALPGAHIKLLALIDIEKEGRRLRLIEFLATAVGGVDQIGQRRLAVEKLSIQSCCRWTRFGSVASNCYASRKQSTSALIGSAPGLSVKKHHCRLF